MCQIERGGITLAGGFAKAPANDALETLREASYDFVQRFRINGQNGMEVAVWIASERRGG